MGEGRSASCGVDKWASCNLRHSERDAQRTMKKQGTKLDVPITSISCDGVNLPWIAPQTWLRFVIKKGLWPVMAGCDRFDHDGARRNWSDFWTEYKKVNPGFELFSMPNVDLSRTAAWLVHGDEGRTLKKNGIMITSLQSALGRGYDEKRVAGPPGKLRVNFAGHSFTTRYIVSATPKTVYESTPEVFHSSIDHVAKSLSKCLHEGFVDVATGETFRVAVLGVKGDAPYLAKVAHFYRSYNTTAKRGEERGPPKGICPYCLAGTNGFPAEELSTLEPRWLRTIGVKLPWVRCPSLIQNLVHDRGDPAAFFKTDLWHVVHLGFGRSWVASVIQLLLSYLPCANLDEKWDYLTTHYLRWCTANKRQAHVAKITPYLMSYGDSSGAMGNWHKGALTSNFMHWLVDLLGDVRGEPGGLLVQCRAATYRMNAMFSLLYRAGAFLSEQECSFVSEQGLQFLKTYSMLAGHMFGASKQWMFPLYPKLHMFHHQMLEIRFLGNSVKTAASPMMFACQMDEDTVGRSSRLSRRVNIRRVSLRTLDRYLVSAYAAHAKAGLLV